MSSKPLILIQARMGSSRLPGKVLKDIEGKPMLQWVIERCQRARSCEEVAVATTLDPTDDIIIDFCNKANVAVHRGSVQDVLDRFVQAARAYNAETVVRITADCPVIDPVLIDDVVNLLEGKKADYATNRLPPPFHRTYPIGLDVEVVTVTALERAWREAKEPFEREHVMPYLYDKEGRFKVEVLNYEEDLGGLRWTVDTAEDLEFIQAIYRQFAPLMDFGWKDVLGLVKEHPEIMKINTGITHKSFLDVDERNKGEK